MLTKTIYTFVCSYGVLAKIVEGSLDILFSKNFLTVYLHALFMQNSMFTIWIDLIYTYVEYKKGFNYGCEAREESGSRVAEDSSI